MIKNKGVGTITKFQNWIEAINHASRTCIVIVNSKKAKETLEEMGVRNVVQYQDPYYSFVETLEKKGKEIILLLNVSKSSDSLCERLRSDLQKRKIKVNSRFRKLLFISEMKDLGGLLKFLKERVYDSQRKETGMDEF